MAIFSFWPRWAGDYNKIRTVNSLRPGDHIMIWDFTRPCLSYQHHGIVWLSGDSLDTIHIYHMWSPLSNYAEAQADSCIRITSLRDFLDGRKSCHLRLVEYCTSGLRELLSSWGEVHLTEADTPEIVLLRCIFLMGLGKGEFHILRLNCEHIAHWCKTGELWCKQSMRWGRGGPIPFRKQVTQEQIEDLHSSIERVKTSLRNEVNRITALNNSLVYVRINDGEMVLKVADNNQVVAVPSPVENGTAFRLSCYEKAKNSIRVSFYSEETSCYMFSRSTLSCFRDVRMKKKNCLRRKSGLTWQLHSTGNLVSRNQHRRYLGLRSKDNVVVDVSARGDAARFDLFPIEHFSIRSPFS